MLVWMDLETTGLSARADRILEVAVIVTDDQFQELGRFHRVTSEANRTDFTKVDPFVKNMHSENGLWCESLLAPRYGENATDIATVRRGELADVDDVDRYLVACLLDHMLLDAARRDGLDRVPEYYQPEIKKTDHPQLAGNTVSFDRNFVERWMPETFKLLHYRNLDVSSINEIAKRFWPAVWEGRPRQHGSKHRAVEDIQSSLDTARYYAAALGPRMAWTVGLDPAAPGGDMTVTCETRPVFEVKS